MVTRVVSAALGCLVALVGCNVASHVESTGGVGADGGDRSCPRAIAVLNSDYLSTSISAVAVDGRVLSASLVSSASKSVGTSAALSGDVVLPLEPMTTGELVLIDRYPNGVITWIDGATARVRAQLNVNTGFSANAHDYLQVSPSKAYVSRYSSNRNAGREPFDAGSDLLIVDPMQPAVVGRIDLAGRGGSFLANPDRMRRVGNDVVVTLGRLDAAFTSAGDGLLVGIDPKSDTVAWDESLPGLSNCSGLALSPSGRLLAVSCSGVFSSGPVAQAEHSDVVVLDTTRRPPVERARYGVPSKLGGQAVAPPLAFATEDLLLGVSLGDLAAGRSDTGFSLTLSTGVVMTFTHAAPFALGDLLCLPGCSARCFLADASRGAIVPLEVDSGTVTAGSALQVDTTTGLPPRSLNIF
jgi:hypothetical protein